MTYHTESCRTCNIRCRLYTLTRTIRYKRLLPIANLQAWRHRNNYWSIFLLFCTLIMRMFCVANTCLVPNLYCDFNGQFIGDTELFQSYRQILWRTKWVCCKAVTIYTPNVIIYSFVLYFSLLSALTGHTELLELNTAIFCLFLKTRFHLNT
jgi:prepilin signal peptidase PulO-like enzyme (type II secretory pathway)